MIGTHDLLTMPLPITKESGEHHYCKLNDNLIMSFFIIEVYLLQEEESTATFTPVIKLEIIETKSHEEDEEVTYKQYVSIHFMSSSSCRHRCIVSS
jgi:hypothetical protein